MGSLAPYPGQQSLDQEKIFHVLDEKIFLLSILKIIFHLYIEILLTITLILVSYAITTQPKAPKDLYYGYFLLYVVFI